ncbi:F-box protein At5g03100-like [Lycium ferocissimum]|uniref:F-box protein At5g03100-like n=1 Tax=Lycium ferocissimum TaxID=112874 RepID=UPI0028163BA9|nr:F-box protein At5g03100-like [Lycium ferocissimum]
MDRLSDLPEPILIHILSMLPDDGKQVVRTSVLSTRWRFIWMSVLVSLDFNHSSKKGIADFIASVHRELYYWRSCDKIRRFNVYLHSYDECYAKDVDLWLHFATTKVEDFFRLGIRNDKNYEFPQFAYKIASLRNLELWQCQLNPRGSVHWSSLVSLSFGFMNLTESVMKKVLSGCPNLECLELHNFRGIHRLEISSVKLRELSIECYYNDNHDLWLEIIAPHIQTLGLSGLCNEIRIRQRNVASLVTAILYLDFDVKGKERNLEKECSFLKELLQSVAHVENLQLNTWGIECLSILELKGWRSPPSSWKFLELGATLNQLEFPGICSFLQSSSDLETLVISWYGYNHKSRELLSKYINEDEQSRRFETHYFNCSLLHLKTIKFIDYFGPLSKYKSALPLVKYLLKHAIVLEKFVVTARIKRNVASQDYVKMEQEFLSFPRSSPHASVIFSY